MKKKMRTMTCLVLVVLLATSMVVPAMASSGTGTAGSFDYIWQLSYTTSATTGTIRTPNIAATVTAEVKSYVYYDLTGDYGYSDAVKLANYRSVTVSSGAIITINGVPVRGEVQGGYGSFWVDSTRVIRDARA